MCGRFVQYSDPEIYASHFQLDVARLSPGLHTTTASADSWPALTDQVSPSKNMYSRPVPPGSTECVFR
jgi:hypothetical protein